MGNGDPGWNGRGHFFGAAAKAMRDLLVEQARRKAAAKRGGGARRVALEAAEVTLAGSEPELDLLALDEALLRLAAQQPEKARIVELRYFAGLGDAETAAIVGVSQRTVERAWRYAKAWLRREIEMRSAVEVGGSDRAVRGSGRRRAHEPGAVRSVRQRIVMCTPLDAASPPGSK